MARKSRLVYDITDRRSSWVTGSNPPTPSVSTAKGYQVTDSPKTLWTIYQRNPVLRDAQGKYHFDLGGEFYTIRPFARHEKKWSGVARHDLYNFSGDMVAALPPNSLLQDAGLSYADRQELIKRGTTAIARCKPLNPVVDGVTALGEFRKDGLAKLPGIELLQSKGKDLTQKAGSEYLNIEFALKPLISDLKGLYKAANQQEKIISQLYRDSGRPIRRSYTFPTETVVTEKTVYGDAAVPFPALVTQFYSSRNWVKTTRTEVTKTYRFSGAFTYYIPPNDIKLNEMVRMASEAKALYGLRISPEVAYNLTPWSWALDWVSNTGDLIANASAFSMDGLVMRYGYIMCHTTSVTTVTVHGGSFRGGIGSSYKMSYGFESKARLKATPFGFGLNTALFSERQWSIIGALGMTKAPKSFP